MFVINVNEDITNDTGEVFQTYLHKHEDHEDDDVMKMKAKVSQWLLYFLLSTTFYILL